MCECKRYDTESKRDMNCANDSEKLSRWRRCIHMMKCCICHGNAVRKRRNVKQPLDFDISTYNVYDFQRNEQHTQHTLVQTVNKLGGKKERKKKREREKSSEKCVRHFN